MRIQNNTQPTTKRIYDIKGGEVLTIDYSTFFLKVSDYYASVSYGMSEGDMQDLCDIQSNHYLAVDMSTGELASFDRNMGCIPIENYTMCVGGANI